MRFRWEIYCFRKFTWICSGFWYRYGGLVSGGSCEVAWKVLFGVIRKKLYGKNGVSGWELE